ncbi:glycoside hydrolase [Aspergillus brunneoviolaceus CBS 621.78]|uniref:Glycoside hydrolase n=1 Tax=Aspergillus brunneoviolaceus CBS 621.78 TaxID=1450534 RepID=A0ACD1G1A3_9EURO|nr:glycoside hydrolase [Aspergillus brunneoviolaceus CBS 621.78]RAH43046.1 glycoside hydrolase [Aspergillus brunneoviolaceus CBS 621.78]
MRGLTSIPLIALAVSGCVGSPLSDISHKRESNSLGESLGIEADSMVSYDGIYFGWAPNYSPRVTMTDLNEATGQKGATYNVYSQITQDNVESGSYDGNDQYPVDDIIASGAVLIASLMPKVDWEDITPELCESVASYFKDTFTNKGVTVWLRYAHEMNYYADPNVVVYPGGRDYAAFNQTWKDMYTATESNDMIYMFWSPNVDTDSEPIAPWWPGREYVDIVGMDYYPEGDALPDFATAYGSFYDTYAKGYSLPFAIAETGTQLNNGAATTAQKQQWLKSIINPSEGLGDYSEYYVSCTWFEYGPPANSIDFYIVYNQTENAVLETISNTENGS